MVLPARKKPAASQKEPLSEEQRKKMIARRKKRSSIAFVKDWRKGYAYRLVFNGKKKRTSGNLKKRDLMRNKRGRIVSKRRHAFGTRMWKANGLDRWVEGVMTSREELGIKGFVCPKKNAGTEEQRQLYTKILEKFCLATMTACNQRLRSAGSKLALGPTAGAPLAQQAAELAQSLTEKQAEDTIVPQHAKAAVVKLREEESSPTASAGSSQPSVPKTVWPWKK
eukprot:TRINITY_DN12662_c0_g1_i1.p1 TRINITY_DN12662_c0_g1~~TRINITY_DN12662_c0_g1_i1.p1  ORF type:complete len:224 (-),score=69.92 TRINITY_DN12662_c0_g1_i1:100-771(-)